MKIAVVGIDFPLGKKNLSDDRLDKLKDLFHSPKVTFIQIEFQDSTHTKDVDGILCEKCAKLELILQDLEIVESRLNDEQNKDLFSRAKEALEKEIILSEVLGKMADDGKVIYGYEFEGKWLECGNKLNWLKSNLYLCLKNQEFGKDLKKILEEESL